MAMPLLKDFLPREEPAPSAVLDDSSPQLDNQEAKLIRAEKRAAALRQAIENFIAALRGHLPNLSEDDLFLAYQQIDAEDQVNRPAFAAHIAAAQEKRAKVARMKPSPARNRALQLYDREIRMLKLAIAGFEWGKEQTEALRDAVLVRETQEFSAHAFWGDDDDY